MVSAIMQSVSGVDMGVALAIEGGLAFIYGNQTPEQEAAMVKAVKDHKAGFVESGLHPYAGHDDAAGHGAQGAHRPLHHAPSPDDGTPRGKLLGIVTSRDYRPSRDDHQKKVREFMTPRERLIVGDKDITLKKANDVIWDNKLNALPVVDENDHLVGIVFRKDYDQHKSNPNELLDANKRYMVGRGHQYARLRRARAAARGGRRRRALHRLLRGASPSGRSARSSGSAPTTATRSRWVPATSWTRTASASSPTAARTS